VESVDEAVDGVEGVLLGDVIQVGIAGRGGRACVAEESLDMPEAQALLKQMSGKAVSKGMDGDFFLMPHWVTTAFMAA